MKLDAKALTRSKKVFQVLVLHKIYYKAKEALDFERALPALQLFSW